jgi:hypothetical protein
VRVGESTAPDVRWLNSGRRGEAPEKAQNDAEPFYGAPGKVRRFAIM